jgi:hypothetical protein
MTPEVILFVLSFPGRKAVRFEENRLPEVGVLTGMECTAAETTIQKELVASMQQTLRTAEIGMRDDFFVLDGQSLKAVELISESTRDTALTGTCASSTRNRPSSVWSDC